MRYILAIIAATIMGCGNTDPVSPEVAKRSATVDTADAQLNLIRTLKATVTWTIDPVTYDGTVNLVIVDGRDTVAYIERGTLTNLHSCTAGGFGQALYNNVVWTFEDLGIPDTSSNCIESEW